MSIECDVMPWGMPVGGFPLMPKKTMAEQDFTPGAKPYYSSTADTLCREYEILTEDGRHLATLRTTMHRKDIGKKTENLIGWEISAHAIDERAVKVRK